MKKPSYRYSHCAEDYGTQYSNAYQKGYYRHQWKKLEEPLLRSILQQCREDGALSALDFACGTGRILSVVEDYIPETIGVDVSESMLEIARQVCPRSEIIRQDITLQPLDRKVDVVTAFRFFVNAEPQLRDDALQAIGSCLNSDGLLIANVHQNATSPLGIAYRSRNAITRKRKANVLRHEVFKDILNRGGFSVRKTYWYSFMPRPGWWAGELIGRMMVPFETTCERMLVPKRWAQAFLIVAQKQET